MIFLTSSVGSVADHIYKNFLIDKKFSSVLFIDTAAEPSEVTEHGDEWLQRDLQSLRNLGCQVDRYSMTGQDLSDIEAKIDAYDIIYMCGGDPAYLLEQLHATGALTLIKEKTMAGKPYIGTSAGSIVAGPQLPDYFLEEGREVKHPECMGLVNFTLVPHWGDEYFKERYIGQRLESVYKFTQHPLLLLTDSQYVEVLDNGSFNIHIRD